MQYTTVNVFLLKSNNISNRLTEELAIQNTNSNVKPAYMTIKKLYFYAGILYSLLITKSA